MATDFEFGINLNSDAPVGVEFVQQTLRYIQSLLVDIERSITDGRSRTKWHWRDEASLNFVARVNGVDESTLKRIVTLAKSGFENAMLAGEQGHDIQWPEEFRRAAKDSTAAILNQLNRLESLTIAATGSQPIEISKVRLQRDIEAHSVRRIHSSVEGTLEMVSRRAGMVRAGLREVRTGRYVRCRFVASEWLETLRERQLWDRRVVVYGMVAYDDEGNPESVNEIDEVSERDTSISLLDFEGVAPALTGGLSAEDFMEQLRGGESE